MRESKSIEADYLIVGSGAMGMAFADTIVNESRASVILVDRYAQPGGHWNHAYPFVRLHSASAYYGVTSSRLGQDSIDETGMNRGYYERASAAEICEYYDRLMRERFQPTGRVQYFPRCDYRGDGRFISLESGDAWRVTTKKIVNATFTDTAIPSQDAPKYTIAQGARCITPNALPSSPRADRYTVVGAGKTGMDVCSWLLEHEVPADHITWIMPRDSWLLDREFYEPRDGFWSQRMGALATQVELIVKATSVEHLFELLDEHGQLLRLDPNVTPTRYRCATVSRAELAQLRRVKNIVRLGHVRSIEARQIVLDRGVIATSPGTLNIDCTAGGIRTRAPVPVFNAETITLQALRTCQQCFSAALIAHIELGYESESEKNALCRPIPLPIRDVDWLHMFAANLANQSRWVASPELRTWIAQTRLDLNYGRTSPLTSEENALLHRFKASVGHATGKIATMLQGAAVTAA